MQRRLLLHLMLGQSPPFDAEEDSRLKSSTAHDGAADDDALSKDDHGLRRCIERWEPTFEESDCDQAFGAVSVQKYVT